MTDRPVNTCRYEEVPSAEPQDSLTVLRTVSLHLLVHSEESLDILRGRFPGATTAFFTITGRSCAPYGVTTWGSSRFCPAVFFNIIVDHFKEIFYSLWLHRHKQPYLHYPKISINQNNFALNITFNGHGGSDSNWWEVTTNFLSPQISLIQFGCGCQLVLNEGDPLCFGW